MRHFIDNGINQINQLFFFNFEKLENGNLLYFPKND